MSDPHDQHGSHDHGHAGHSHGGHAHGTGGDHDSHGDHGSHGIAKYLYVFLALTVLTSASFFTYSDYWPYHDTPAVGWTFMMAVSCSKALLVMLFFMHLKYEASWKYVLTIPASVMAIFLMLALVPDVKWRFEQIAGGRRASDERLLHSFQKWDADPAEHEAAGH
jgi:cytochrome c oxidase subunit 4